MLYLAWGGFAIGACFGLLVQQTNFCAMGAIADIVSFQDYRRFRAWLLACAVALIGTQAASHFGVVDLTLSMYLGTSIHWVGNLFGGVVFGIGMVLAGGCPSRNLVRAGSGDLRSLVVLVVLGISAYATLGGVLGPTRVWLESATAIPLADGHTQSLAALLADAGFGGERGLTWLVTLTLAVALLIYCFKEAGFRQSPRLLIGGLGVGLCVVAGWALTGLAYDEFAAQPFLPQSLSYVRPSGDALEYVQRYSAGHVPEFGAASVFGAIIGGSIGSLFSRRFRLSGFADADDTWRNLLGAVLMGVGGVVALGCTVGQSLSGVATLAVGSMLTFVAIIVGGVIGMKWLERSLLA